MMQLQIQLYQKIQKKRKKAFFNLCIPLLLSFLAYEEFEEEGKISNNKLQQNKPNGFEN